MQHHSRQRTTRPFAPVRAATLRFRQQMSALQERLRPTVAPREPVSAHQMFVEMPRREALIAHPIQALDLLAPVHRHPTTRRLADPTVQQTRLTFLFVATAPTPEGPFANTQQLRRLLLVQLRRVPAAKYVPELQHTNTLSGFRQAHPRPPKRPGLTGQIVCYLNRTYRVLPTPRIPPLRFRAKCGIVR
jgi:hypothetical protein